MFTKFKQYLFSGPQILRNQAEIKQQLDRMEDKLCRIEDGLEAAGYLQRESFLNQRNQDHGKLTLEESFDYIYKHNTWDKSGSQPSGGGSYGPWAQNFVGLVLEFVAANKIRTITDVGCGDFNVGRQIAPAVEKYNALDISREIIGRNRQTFANMDQVDFKQANACIDPLPVADLVIVRQVLQHLTNAQVESILQNVEKTGFKFAIVAEHHPFSRQLKQPNLDLESQGHATRIKKGSGIFIDQAPFARPARQIASFQGKDGVLGVYLWSSPSMTAAPA